MKRHLAAGLWWALALVPVIGFAQEPASEPTASNPDQAAADSDQTADSIPVKSDADEDKKDDGKDDDDDRDESRKVTYSSIGLTRASTDFDNLGEAINLSAVLGIRVPTVEFISAEIDLSTTLIPGENTLESSGVLGGGGGTPCVLPGVPPGCVDNGGGSAPTGNNTQSRDDLLLNTVGVFGVLRSPGTFYGVGKYGYRYIQSTIQELQEEASGTAYALGAGYRYGSDGGVEIMYTKYSDFIDYISLTVTYGFGGDDEEVDNKVKKKMEGEIVEDRIEDGIEDDANK